MATADALNKYFRRARRWFPFGFSKYFHISTSGERRRYKEIKALDNQVINDLLCDVRQEAIALQNKTSNLTYHDLIKTFGSPRNLMRELILEEIPEETFNRFLQKRFRTNACLAVCAIAVIATLSVFSFHVSTIQSSVNVQESNTVFIDENNDTINARYLNIVNFIEFVKNLD